METGIKSSFIPQSPVVATAQARRRSGGFDFLMLIALVLFVASVTLAIGVFLYVQFIQRSNVSKRDQLERAQAAFEPALIAELGRLDARMRAADQVLANHIAPTVLFQLLEQTTLQTVSFSSLTFTAANGEMTLSMEGLAQSVNSIALQADHFSKSGLIENPIFADINRQPGGIHFSVTADVRPEALDYRTHLTAPNPQATPQQPLPPPVMPEEAPSPFGATEESNQTVNQPVTGDTTPPQPMDASEATQTQTP